LLMDGLLGTYAIGNACAEHDNKATSP
jgi:hypothetical protein